MANQMFFKPSSPKAIPGVSRECANEDSSIGRRTQDLQAPFNDANRFTPKINSY